MEVNDIKALSYHEGKKTNKQKTSNPLQKRNFFVDNSKNEKKET